ncbi:MAG: integrase, partial [Deltaproteobacteria bacterium HGW-Deltaproteobacteria-24]
MRYPIDFLATFDKTLLFWLERFIKLKLTTLSNRNVKDKQAFNAIIQQLNKGVHSIEELKKLSKEARQEGLIGINTYIN